jgi:hypothetical protein
MYQRSVSFTCNVRNVASEQYLITLSFLCSTQPCDLESILEPPAYEGNILTTELQAQCYTIVWLSEKIHIQENFYVSADTLFLIFVKMNEIQYQFKKNTDWCQSKGNKSNLALSRIVHEGDESVHFNLYHPVADWALVLLPSLQSLHDKNTKMKGQISSFEINTQTCLTFFDFKTSLSKMKGNST